MADVTSIYGNPIKDAVARADIATNTQDISDLKDGLSDLEASMTETINSVYVTDTANGSLASFPDGADGVPVKSLTVDIEPVQSGSGDPSPTNIRPISGHPSAVVTRTGKNLLVYPFGNTAPRTINGVTFTPNSDGSVTANGTASSHAVYTIHESMPIHDGTYILSGGKSAEKFIGLGYFDSDTATTENRVNDIATSVATFTSHKGIITFIQLVIKSGQTLTNEVFYPMIRVSSDTDDTFAPYTAQTYEIDLDGTRYGGTLDVTTGVLTVTHGFATLNGSESWLVNSATSGLYYITVTNMLGSGRLYSDSYVQTNVPGASMTVGQMKGVTPNIVNFKTSYATVAAWKTALASDSVQLLYELNTPFTVQLTSNDITTALGQNNIWNDCGDTTVEYRADTKLYIEKLTAPTEDDMIADHAISANTFFMVGNTLYRATTAIASGATITVGTNATRLSLSDALNTLS